MRYIREEDIKAHRVNLDCCANIHVSGSVRGMQIKYNWPKNGQVRIGSYVYNLGPTEIERLRSKGIVRGE